MRAAVSGILLAILLAAPAAALEGVLPAPGTVAWRPLDFPKIPAHTRYEAVEASPGRALRAVSECSASARLLSLEGADLEKTPRLRWRWKVELPIDSPLDERSKQGDDFAARVYVTFAFVPERASFFERARQRLGTSLYGEQLPGSAINYVWSRSQPAGRVWDNPFAETNKMVSRGKGPLDDWRVEEVDLLRDYRRLFGVDAPEALFLAVMTDTDNTCRKARAYYADFELLPRESD